MFYILYNIDMKRNKWPYLNHVLQVWRHANKGFMSRVIGQELNEHYEGFDTDQEYQEDDKSYEELIEMQSK